MNKQKFLRRVLPLIVVVCLIGALGTVFYLRTIKEPPPTPDELWPEQGDVIATIDGREYRYDQVYLFRLTGYWFPEKYRESTLDTYEGEEYRQGYTPYITNAYYGIFWGDTWAENAVCLELFYREAKKQYLHNATHFLSKKDTIEELIGDMRSRLTSFLDTYHGALPGMIEDEKRIEETAGIGFEQVCFEPGQSLNDYYRDDAPYIEKLYYINECANNFLEKNNGMQIRDLLSKEEREEANQELFLQYPGLRDEFLVPRLKDALMEKYNVQMMTE